ncbi:MAG TPA: hypothetical protein VNG71_11435 [Pyrinomonadaceae bacterium]|nr:hypothetical protein [Pyrinomonadaceae bacterium]
MKKGTKHLLSGLALGVAAAGAIGAIIMNRNGKPKRGRRRREETGASDVWARPGMQVTFRAELMPGREASERTFQVTELLRSGRVLLSGAVGEHTQTEFEPGR